MFSLQGKVAIITGGSSGMGDATVKRFVMAGAKVFNLDLAEPDASSPAEFIKANVAEPDEIARIFEQVYSHCGKLDILVNNAGIAKPQPFEQISVEMLNRHWQVNSIGVLFGIKEAAKRMQPGSAIVNNVSLGAYRTFPFQTEYAMSKAAALAATKAAAVELGPKGIRVNCVCPGTIQTPLSSAEVPEVLDKMMQALAAAARVGKPEEVAAAIHFLASDDASYINGQSIIVDGGWSVGTSVALVERLAGA
jgi:NAD(P)-dependent dehydrogenase (short-subunit alcohol dehydrogenase family)